MVLQLTSVQMLRMILYMKHIGTTVEDMAVILR